MTAPVAESGLGGGVGGVRPYYQDASVTLYHGDACEMSLPIAADLLLTDPPYSRAGGLATGRSAAHLMAEDSASSDQFWLHWFAETARQILRGMKPAACGIVFCDYRTIHLVERAFARSRMGWHLSQGLVWDRESIGMGSPFRACFEMMGFVRGPGFSWAGRKDIGNVLKHRWPYGAHANHPAEKPVGLLDRIIRECSQPGQLVFDPFTGSGSALVAAKLAGRRAIGIELEEAYCEVAARRLAQDALLFGGEGLERVGESASNEGPREGHNAKSSDGSGASVAEGEGEQATRQRCERTAEPFAAMPGSANVSGARARSGSGGGAEPGETNL